MSPRLELLYQVCMLEGTGVIIVCVLMHVHARRLKTLVGYSIPSESLRNLHQFTQTCHSICKLCSSTANHWSIPCIHSHLDHAHMYGRPFSLSQFHMQSRAAEIANICLENECRGQTLMQGAALGSISRVQHIAHFVCLFNCFFVYCMNMVLYAAFKYFM